MYMSQIKDEARSLEKLHRLSNYLAVAQIFLQGNYFLERELKFEDIKPRLLGHWGTTPGINFVYAQINRLINKNQDRDFIFTVGPGHGYPAFQANLLIEGSLSHFLPEKIPYSREGFEYTIDKFSVPYGFPSHLNPESPGVLLEGGELGYSLSVATGSVLDNKNLINVCLIGDGEAETGPLSTSWAFNRFLSPKSDGAVLPVLHLNGYKISGPTLFSRMDEIEIKKYFKSRGFRPFFIDVFKKKNPHIRGMEIFDRAIRQIKHLQERARRGESIVRPK